MSKTTNSVHEEILEEKKKFKEMSLKEKEKYIWDYYRMKIFVGCIVLFFVILFAVQIAEALRPSAFYLIYCNSLSYVSDDSYEQGFLDYAGIDTENYNYNFDYDTSFEQNGYTYTTVASLDKIKSYSQNGKLDITIGSESDITYLAGYGYFSTDITELMDADVLEAVSDRLYYYEYTESTSNSVSGGNAFEAVSQNTLVEGEPVQTAILAIDISDVPSFKKIGLWEDENETHLLTINPISENLENVNAFLRYMFIEEDT